MAGSLRMNTSLPSKRNSRGRRTAWLRPLVKSLAVLVRRAAASKRAFMDYIMIYTD